MNHLTECNQGLTTNDQFSTQTDILYDVSHGSILGPLLLNQFLCDILLFNNNTNFTSHATGTTTDCLGKNLEEVVTNLKISFRINTYRQRYFVLILILMINIYVSVGISLKPHNNL